ncbi:hypothetical protein [Streptomyces sp. NPDC096033]|uniref:hypothetical protein n=1 Tax=Streptomyces sp. NPDC096033 TaxID=3366071 RepID=UPI00380CFF1B
MNAAQTVTLVLIDATAVRDDPRGVLSSDVTGVHAHPRLPTARTGGDEQQRGNA